MASESPRAPLEQLIAQWRERARDMGVIYASGLEACAAELETALNQPDASEHEPDIEAIARSTADRVANRIEYLARTLNPAFYPLSERERLMREAAVEEILKALRDVVRRAYREIVGCYPDFIASEWGESDRGDDK